MKTQAWRVTLDKHGATWYYFTRNEVGGGFGSNNCGPQHVAMARATANIPSGVAYDLVINGKSRGCVVKP